MDSPFNSGVNNRNRGNVRPLSFSGIEKKINMPNFLNPDMHNISMGGFDVYERDSESVLKSKVFGIPLYIVAIIGAALWFLKK